MGHPQRCCSRSLPGPIRPSFAAPKRLSTPQLARKRARLTTVLCTFSVFRIMGALQGCAGGGLHGFRALSECNALGWGWGFASMIHRECDGCCLTGDLSSCRRNVFSLGHEMANCCAFVMHRGISSEPRRNAVLLCRGSGNAKTFLMLRRKPRSKGLPLDTNSDRHWGRRQLLRLRFVPGNGFGRKPRNGVPLILDQITATP
jgi:hypothetical protein